MVRKVMTHGMLIFSQIHWICRSTSGEFQSMLSLLTETEIFIMPTLTYPRAKTKSARRGYRNFLYSTWDATEGLKAGTSFMCSRLPSRGDSFAFADCEGSLEERVSYASLSTQGLAYPAQTYLFLCSPGQTCSFPVSALTLSRAMFLRNVSSL